MKKPGIPYGIPTGIEIGHNYDPFIAITFVTGIYACITSLYVFIGLVYVVIYVKYRILFEFGA